MKVIVGDAKFLYANTTFNMLQQMGDVDLRFLITLI